MRGKKASREKEWEGRDTRSRSVLVHFQTVIKSNQNWISEWGLQFRIVFTIDFILFRNQTKFCCSKKKLFLNTIIYDLKWHPNWFIYAYIATLNYLHIAANGHQSSTEKLQLSGVQSSERRASLEMMKKITLGGHLKLRQPSQ